MTVPFIQPNKELIDQGQPVVMTKEGPVIMNIGMALQRLDNDTSINVDLETSGLHHRRDKIAVFNMHGNDSGTDAVLHVRGKIYPEIIEFFKNRNRKYIFHNGVGFDIPFMRNYGIENAFELDYYDTLVGESCVLVTDRKDVRRDLDSVGKRRTGHQVKAKKVDHGGWMNPYLDGEQVIYGISDVRGLDEIRKAHFEKADANITRAIHTEMKIVPIVAEMKYNGISIDPQALYSFLQKQYETGSVLNKKLQDFFEMPTLNIGSHTQLKSAFKKAGITMLDGSEIPNTQTSTLEEIVKFAPDSRDGRILQAIIETKACKKRLETYTPEWYKTHVVNGKIHPNFWQTGTDTGRFSSTNPNLQQVPRDMRNVFGGRQGYQILSGDYSQIEVRVAAALANDEELIRLICTGLHIHTSLASQVFGVVYEEVTKMMITLAKGITFLLLFGGGKEKFYWYCSRNGSGLSKNETDAIFERFFNIFRGIKNMRDQANASARTGRPVTLVMASGLKRILVGKVWATQILNTITQGNAAAGIKFALLEAKKSGLIKYLCLQVHDELVSEVPDDEQEDYGFEMIACMKRGMQRIMKVPTEISMTRGLHWVKD